MAVLSLAFLLLGFALTSADKAGEVEKEDQLRSRLREYGLVTPFSTDSRGRYLSHLLSAAHKQRAKREAPPPGEAAERELFFNISAFGREFHLRLRPNTRLVAPGAVVEWHEETPGAADPADGGRSTAPTRRRGASSAGC
ncbi:adamts3 [Pungitius sinensis]